MEKEDNTRKLKVPKAMLDKHVQGGFHLTKGDSKVMAREYSRITGCEVHHSDVDPCINQRTTVKACDSYVVYRKDKQPINLCHPIKPAMLELAQVQFFFEHEFEEKTYNWAYLSTFDKVKRKKGFLFANTESSKKNLILKGNLSKAIITAEYGHKVYFINLNIV